MQTSKLTPLVPVLTEHSRSHFVSEAFAPTKEVLIDGVVVSTRPLVMGKRVSLLGIGSSSELLEAGVIDPTDVIDPSLALSSLYVFFPAVGRTVAIDLTGKPYTQPHHAYVEGGSFQQLLLHFEGKASVSLARESDAKESFWRRFTLTIRLTVTGQINLELGDCIVEAQPLELMNAESAAPWMDYVPENEVLHGLMEGALVVGYELSAHRVNHNRRRA